MKEFLECIICGGDITPDKRTGWSGGYNPAPISDYGRACLKCDETTVMAERLRRMGYDEPFVQEVIKSMKSARALNEQLDFTGWTL